MTTQTTNQTTNQAPKDWDYKKERTKLLDKLGVIFAFNQQQFDDERVEGVDYESLGSGMICPKGQGKSVFDALKSLEKKQASIELETKGTEKIIWDALANYECQISCDFTDAVESLKPYGITEEQIKQEWPKYMQDCIDNDYF